MSRHLKKYTAPPTWPITRKDQVYITKPSPGPHGTRFALPLDLIIRILGLTHTKREIKKILTTNTILVDNRRIKNATFPVGILDTLSFPALNKHYRVVFDTQGKLALAQIPANEATTKIAKVIGKKILANGTLQINLSDGRNLITKEKNYAVGDTTLIELPTQKIQQHLKLEPGALIYLVDGKHLSDIGVVDQINQHTITYTTKAQHKVQTLKAYAYVVGKDTPLITLT